MREQGAAWRADSGLWGDRHGSAMRPDAPVVSPAQPVVDTLSEAGEALAIAESITGGLVAAMVTDVPGASDVLDRALVVYTVSAKQDALGVDATLLKEHGPVSEPVAREMAQRVRETAGTRWGVATTGIAGPSGGTDQTPVGTVFVAVADAAEVSVDRYRFAGDRWTVRRQAAKQALADLLEHRP